MTLSSFLVNLVFSKSSPMLNIVRLRIRRSSFSLLTSPAVKNKTQEILEILGITACEVCSSQQLTNVSSHPFGTTETACVHLVLCYKYVIASLSCSPQLMLLLLLNKKVMTTTEVVLALVHSLVLVSK